MSQTLSQEITGKLTRRIVDDHYPAGTKLPTERELSVEFGVTRHVIREALKRLEAVGLVSIRQGSGIVVQDLQLTGGVALFDVLLRRDDGSLNMDVLRDVLEFRSHMMRTIVRLAATRRTDAELQELKRLYEERKRMENDPVQGDELVRRLFQLISQAAHNRVYELMFNTVGRIAFVLLEMVDLPVIGEEKGQHIMDRIIEAFEHKDEAMADLLVARYLNAVHQALIPELRA